MRRTWAIAARLENAGPDNTLALVVADKMRMCSDISNVWHGDGLHTDDGEVFQGAGTLWRCSERLCPNCLSIRSRRARHSVREGMLRAPKPTTDIRWRFVTLTMPTLPAAQTPLLETLDIMSRAWRLFSKSDYWRGFCEVGKSRGVEFAGIKGVEFTLGKADDGDEWMPDVNGYHAHIHLLILSPWVEWQKLREEWTSALLKTYAENDIEQSINTSDGYAVVDVRLVTTSKTKRGLIGLKGAIQEVCKYVTKTESWLKIPDAQLVSVANVNRWPRMFELLGECRQKSDPNAPKRVKGLTINERIKERDRKLEAWRQREAYQQYLDSYSDEEYKRLYDRLRAVVDAPQRLFPEEHDTDAARRLRREAAEALAQLDTRHVSGGEFDITLEDLCLKPRPPTFRSVGVEYVEKGERSIWLSFLQARVAESQRHRISQLSSKYPYAEFWTIEGSRWYGWEAAKHRDEPVVTWPLDSDDLESHFDYPGYCDSSSGFEFDEVTIRRIEHHHKCDCSRLTESGLWDFRKYEIVTELEALGPPVSRINDGSGWPGGSRQYYDFLVNQAVPARRAYEATLLIMEQGMVGICEGCGSRQSEMFRVIDGGVRRAMPLLMDCNICFRSMLVTVGEVGYTQTKPRPDGWWERAADADPDDF